MGDTPVEPLHDLAEYQTATLVFHLAAQIDVRLSVADPVDDAATNVLGTINVAAAAQSMGAQVVFVSTGGAQLGVYTGR